MPIALLYRLARYLAGRDLYIGRRRLPRGFYGLACGNVIFYATGLSSHQRALTVLHEVCHVLFDVIDPSVVVRPDGFAREQWREDRADRFAAHVLELVANGATPTEIGAIRGDHPIMQRGAA